MTYKQLISALQHASDLVARIEDLKQEKKEAEERGNFVSAGLLESQILALDASLDQEII
jgi:hypothetical protein